MKIVSKESVAIDQRPQRCVADARETAAEVHAQARDPIFGARAQVAQGIRARIYNRNKFD